MTVSLASFALTDKVAIVTAAGSGIGKGISLGFASVGANVVLADINPDTLEVISSEVCQIGRHALTVVADMTKEDDVDKLVNQAINKFGRIDILANVVGGLQLKHRGHAIELSEESWDSIVILNLKTAFLCSRAVARVMIDQKVKGSIINTASMVGIAPHPGGSHYGAAKAGIIHLTKTLAAEWGSFGIRVNAIAPGCIETPLSKEAMRFFKTDQKSLASRIPLGRIGQPEDIATVAIFLASDASAYVTGDTIVVTGGLQSMV